MARFDFNLADQESSDGDFTPAPAGIYSMKAIDAEVKDTKAGTGQYIAVTFEIEGPTHKGRKVWMNFNVSNPSEKAQEIGRGQVASWARSAGKPNARDTDELLERRFSAKLDIEKSAGYPDKNTIKSFLLPDGTLAQQLARPVAAPAAHVAQMAEPTPTPTQQQQVAETAVSAAVQPAAQAAGNKPKMPWDI